MIALMLSVAITVGVTADFSMPREAEETLSIPERIVDTVVIVNGSSNKEKPIEVGNILITISRKIITIVKILDTSLLTTSNLPLINIKSD